MTGILKQNRKEEISMSISHAFKQLLPLKYSSNYRVGEQKQFATWNMWFGKVFNHKVVTA